MCGLFEGRFFSKYVTKGAETHPDNKESLFLFSSQSRVCGTEPRSRPGHRNYNQENEKKTKTLTGSFQAVDISAGDTLRGDVCLFLILSRGKKTSNG